MLSLSDKLFSASIIAAPKKRPLTLMRSRYIALGRDLFHINSSFSETDTSVRSIQKVGTIRRLVLDVL
ncbi:MAG: hypothetical protein ACXAEI_07165, partial [Candidatus Hodarchaeales archaeon]